MAIAKLASRVLLRSIVCGFGLLMPLAGQVVAQAPGAGELLPRPYLGDPVFVTSASESLAAGTAVARPKLLDGGLKEPTSAISRLAPQSATAQPAVPEPVASSTPATASTEYDSPRSRRFWVEADYLLWWMRGDSLPALVTSSQAGTPRALAGVLGAPGTTVLFGNSTDSGQALSGGSITLGYWLNDCQTCGVLANFFMLGSQVSNFSAASNGQAILARPFFDVTTGKQGAQLISFPGVVSGGVGISDTSSLLGAGVWGRHCLFSNACFPYRVDALVGFRYLRLTDDLSIDENLISTVANNGIPAGTTFGVSDRFSTQNNFYGLDLGLTGEARRGRWVLTAFAQLALGVTCEEVDISGSTRVTVPGGAPVVNQGGLLALQSNIGHLSRARFAVVPEVGVKMGYQITENLRLQAGYNFLFWSEVARPGNQIDTSINPNLLPPVVGAVGGPVHPAANIQGTSFWAQGLSLGILFKF